MTEKSNIFDELELASLQLLDFTTTNDHTFFSGYLSACEVG
jgi:hypothetical protein